MIPEFIREKKTKMRAKFFCVSCFARSAIGTQKTHVSTLGFLSGQSVGPGNMISNYYRYVVACLEFDIFSTNRPHCSIKKIEVC